MEKILGFLSKRKYWLLILGVIACSFLLLKFLFFKEKAETLTGAGIPPPAITGRTLPQQTSLRIKIGAIPKELPVYQGIKAVIPPETATEMAQKLGFDTPPLKSIDAVRGDFFLWASEQNSLSIGLEAPEVDYSTNNLNALAAKGELPSVTQAQTIFNRLLEKLMLPAPSSSTLQNISYFKIHGDALKETRSASAEFIRIGLTGALEQYPLVDNNPSHLNNSLLLGRNGEIARFYYRPYYSQFLKIGAFPLKSQKQISQFLTAEGKIVQHDLEEEGEEVELQEVVLTQISLAYLQPVASQEPIQPIYILLGEGISSSGQKANVTVYLPAFVFK